MQWEGRRESGNVEDRRGMGGMRLGLPFGGGIGGLALLLLILWVTGTNPRLLLNMTTSAPPKKTGRTTGGPRKEPPAPVLSGGAGRNPDPRRHVPHQQGPG